MAGWYNSGVWEGLTVQDLKEILSDLCCAVNEREDMIGRGLSGAEGITEWQLASTTKSNPFPADFDGMPLVTGASGSVEYLISQIRTAIEALLDDGHDYEDTLSWSARYVDSTQTVLLSLSDALSAGSYGSSWIVLSEDRIQNTNIYLQIKECIEELRYIVAYPFCAETEFSSLGASEEYFGEDPLTELRTLYGAIYPTGAPLTLTYAYDADHYCGYRISEWVDNTINVLVCASISYEWHTDGLKGSVISAWIRFEKEHYGTSIEFNTDSPTESITMSGTVSFVSYDESVSSWPQYDTDSTTVLTFTPPNAEDIDFEYTSVVRIVSDHLVYGAYKGVGIHAEDITGISDPYSRAIIDLNGEFEYTA
jgi:hypothetical protein